MIGLNLSLWSASLGKGGSTSPTNLLLIAYAAGAL